MSMILRRMNYGTEEEMLPCRGQVENVFTSRERSTCTSHCEAAFCPHRNRVWPTTEMTDDTNDDASPFGRAALCRPATVAWCWAPRPTWISVGGGERWGGRCSWRGVGSAGTAKERSVLRCARCCSAPRRHSDAGLAGACQGGSADHRRDARPEEAERRRELHAIRNGPGVFSGVSRCWASDRA